MGETKISSAGTDSRFLFGGVSGMGNDLVVKVHYRLGSGNRWQRARVSAARRNLKEA